MSIQPFRSCGLATICQVWEPREGLCSFPDRGRGKCEAYPIETKSYNEIVSGE
jgi:hypothetical protein